MKRIFMLFAIILFAFNILAQGLQSYEGKFKGGHAKYQYQTSPNGSRIYHGTFEFTKEYKSFSEALYTISVKGQYKNDLKNGRWVYSEVPSPGKDNPINDPYKSIELPAYDKHGKVYAKMKYKNSSITLTIDYINGKMDGDYIYVIHTPANSYIRKAIRDTVHLKMKNNRVVSHYKSGENTYIQFDEYGYPHAEWSDRTEDSEGNLIDHIYTFSHGILMKEIKRNESTGDSSQNEYEINNDLIKDSINNINYLDNNTKTFYLKSYGDPRNIQNKLFSSILLMKYDNPFRYSIRPTDFKGESPFEGFPFRVTNTKLLGLSITDQDIAYNLKKVEQAEISYKPFIMAEVMPEFPGGKYAMQEFIADNLKYPQGSNVKGTVVLHFVVTDTGTITDINVIRGLDTELDKEAIRVVSLMPKWNEGSQNGKKVHVYYTLPITFK